jgi:hypothetical protein
MGELQELLTVIAVNAGVLGVVLLVLYQFNKIVRPCGR